MPSPQHTPLHHLAKPALIQTGGRILERDGALWLANAHTALPAHWPSSTPAGLKQGALARVEARWDGAALHVSRILDLRPGQAPARRAPVEAVVARARLYAQLDEFFAARGFIEVMTPAWVAEPGTDIYLDPFAATFRPEGTPRGDDRRDITGWLHTSPEFAMKRLLVEGFERIWQRCPAWRNGEVSARHAPEFTIVEWYRAWESLDAIMDDVEALVRLATDGVARLATGGSVREIDLRQPFKRMTMQQLVARSCAGLDLLTALDYDSLRAACQRHGLLPHRVNQPDAQRPQTGQLYAVKSTDQPIGEDPRWAELFFELQVTHIDPALDHMGAVFITDWPAPLAVLAARDPRDPRVAKRFELYVGGLELTNGFEELTDPHEQRARFIEDLNARAREDMPPLPLPSRFLAALDQGMPPSSGVALGLDRLLMLATGAPTLQHVCPQALRRDAAGDIDWG